MPHPTDNIVAVSELRATGLGATTIIKRCRPGGPWRRLAPGVVMLNPGEPTRRQLVHAAMTYVGREGVVTGIDALIAHGLELACPQTIHVLLPPHRRLQPPHFLLLERTFRQPEPVVIRGVRFAPPERAALDAARREHDPDTLRALLTLPVYYGLCTLEQLRTELDSGNQRGSAAVRALLRVLGHTRDTYVHGVARQLIKRSPLPPPRWDATVCDLRGRPIGTVDAWWDEVGMGWQFSPPPGGQNGRHLGHLSLTAAGVVLVRSSAQRLRTDGHTVLKELASAFRTAATRARPFVQCEVFGATA